MSIFQVHKYLITKKRKIVYVYVDEEKMLRV